MTVCTLEEFRSFKRQGIAAATTLLGKIAGEQQAAREQAELIRRSYGPLSPEARDAREKVKQIDARRRAADRLYGTLVNLRPTRTIKSPAP
jgi:hypothetical protein